MNRKDATVLEPPRKFSGMVRHWGPGLVLTASVVGSGEVIGVPALGAQAGFAVLWLVLVSCVVKLPLQITIGRQAIQTGRTTLQLIDDVPGPRWGASWFIWCFFATLVLANLQQGAMIAGCGQVLTLLVPGIDPRVWAGALVALTIALLVLGSYGLLERLSTILVVSFTLATVVCVGFLQTTDYHMAPLEVLGGLRPRLSREYVGLALGVFAVTGIGTTEIVQYPYWCLDKGYGRHAGVFDGSEAWYRRARGWIRVMHADAALSMVVYTLITVAFYSLGASVLHRLGERPEGMSMIATLSRMYTETLGVWAFAVFVMGAFFALYSTLLVSVAGNTVMYLDALSLMGLRRLQQPAVRERWRRAFVILLPLVQLGLFFAIQMPVAMVKVGALGQTIMLPILAGAIVYIRHKKLDPRLAPSRLTDVLLWGACVLIACVAGYGIYVSATGATS
ncbi:MAG: Nramp family divalent metal transporter [Myxococcales bacterium]|nr:Nramp family divalent metal transporter [Myxococcales bacterium]